jgi:hypothetical protein
MLVSLTYGLADRFFVLLLEAFLSTLVFFGMSISHRGDVIVIINSDIVQEVTVISCFPLPFQVRFWGSLVVVVEPRSLGARGAILPSVLFVVAVNNCSAFSHEH